MALGKLVRAVPSLGPPGVEWGCDAGWCGERDEQRKEGYKERMEIGEGRHGVGWERRRATRLGRRVKRSPHKHWHGKKWGTSLGGIIPPERFHVKP